MRLRNDSRAYGLLSILLHWIMAVLIIVLYVLGTYMVTLDYYHPWYQKAPDLHRGLGVITALLLLLRLGWRLASPGPVALGEPWERVVALWVHRLFYVLMAAVVVSGYLITTAKGQALSVFGWFEIPATLYGIANQEDMAGTAHAWLSDGLIALAVFHALAALKHHFIDRDSTLRRMLVPDGMPSPSSTDKSINITEE